MASAEAPLSMALDAATSLGRALAGFAESLDPYGFDPKILYSGSIDIENKLETASILMPPTAAVR
ncbi:MAG: hypothetical protein E4H08_01845 [Candidatus Atribacteria bacterium]|nr:MAG: hypothetical protein E4H08_01845 [Candidatus Atribacteria bacterium]